jgi:hypothetical protein
MGRIKPMDAVNPVSRPSGVDKALSLAAGIASVAVTPSFGVTGYLVEYLISRQGRPPEDSPEKTDPVFEVINVGDEEDPLGDEVRLIDNGGSASTLTRQITATREWRRSVTIGSVKTVSGSAGVTVGFDGVGLKASIEATLQESYSDETETKQVFSETITISVPPRTKTRVVLSWKALVRSGIVRVTDTDGSVHDVPYRVVTGVTFDQMTQDLPGP